MEVDKAQATEVVHEDGGAPVAFLGEFAFHLRKESDFGGCHLVDRDAHPRLGCDKDFVRGLGFFAAPRNLSHGAKEAASALGWRDFRQLLGDFPVDGELLELSKGKVTEAIVPSHQFGLIVGSSEVDVLPSLRWR